MYNSNAVRWDRSQVKNIILHFDCQDVEDDDGRSTEEAYTISSACEPNGSGDIYCTKSNMYNINAVRWDRNQV